MTSRYKLFTFYTDMNKPSRSIKRFKAMIYTSGAITYALYGNSNRAGIASLHRRAVKALTCWEPGFGGMWPNRYEVFEQVREASGNRAADWKLIETVRYAEIPKDQFEWKRNKAERAARKREEARNIPPPPPRAARRYDTFYDGYVCAISAVIRNGDVPVARELLGGAGPITKDKTDPVDWEVLKNAGFVKG